MSEKICTKCHLPFLATTEYFPPRPLSRSKDGLDSCCRTCHNAASAARYRRNREAINARRRPYWNRRYRQLRSPALRTYEEIEHLTEIECAYIAGLVDGEGSFTIQAAGSTKRMSPFITVAMTHQPTITWLAGKLGLKAIHCKLRNPKYRDQYRVTAMGRRAILLIDRIMSYLLTKREQAQVIADFAALGFAGIDNALGIDDLEAQRSLLKDRIMALNRRGPAVAAA